MNKQILKLFNEAGFHQPEMERLGIEDKFEKFAELIVRECCDWIDGSPSTDAGQLLLTKSFIIANLKGHFGVGS